MIEISLAYLYMKKSKKKPERERERMVDDAFLLAVYSQRKISSLTRVLFLLQQKGGALHKPDHEWVQCDKCRKWRRLDAGFNSKILPPEW